MEYQIQTSGLKCAKTGRELTPGEQFYSVLYDRDATLVREDVCREAWDGPPESAFSFWRSRAPAKDQKKLPINEELLFDCFARLAEESDQKKVNFRYILALLLMRRKRLKFESVDQQDGVEHLVLKCSKTRAQHRVVNPELSEEQLAEVQEEVRVIFDF